MEPTTIGELLHWSYANLAMAHAAVTRGAAKYGRPDWIVRSRLYKGLRQGTMHIGPLADDERLKMILPQACCYCGASSSLAADHLIPRKRGGPEAGDNLVWACRPCNSSKHAIDVLVWLEKRSQFPSLLLLPLSRAGARRNRSSPARAPSSSSWSMFHGRWTLGT